MYETMYQEHKWGKPVYKEGRNDKWKQFDHAFLTVLIVFNLSIETRFNLY